MIVSTEQVITRTKRRLRLNNTENDAYLEKLIDEGARSLKSEDSYTVKCEEIDIDDCHRAKVPSFFEEFLGGRFNDSGCSGCCSTYGTTITEPGSIDTVYRPPCGCPVWFVASWLVNGWNGTGTCGYYGNFFNIEGGYIIFPSSITATSIKLTYKTKNVDESGIMIINEDWERGISAYAASQFAVDYIESYTPEQRRIWSDEWKAQKQSIRSVSQFKRFKLDKQAIWQITNAIIWNGRLTGVVGADGVFN